MNLMRYKWYFIIASTLVVVPGLIALSVWGLKLGIDFTGGSRQEVEFSKPLSTTQVREGLQPLQLKTLEVVSIGERRYRLRMPELSRDQHNRLLAEEQKLGGRELSLETIGPTIGRETTRKAFYSVALASLAIMLYIAWAFRQVPSAVASWQFGAATIVALLHDVLVLVGVFAILGHFFEIEVDALFVTAVLTVIGFSVHDTIVVFDRIRENLRRRGSGDFVQTVNDSIVQTLARSINTSLTVLLALLALYLFGGASIKNFVLALLIGIASGTYSSIFNATPTLVILQEWRAKRGRRAKK